MSERRPRVSIGLPVYNGERYLSRAFDSLLGQTFRDIELVVSDNASTDATAELCRGYAARDPRVICTRNDSNIGIAANHNKTLAMARGELFKWASHDDEYHERFVEACVEAMDAAPPHVALVYTQAQVIDENGVTGELRSDAVASDDPAPHRRLIQFLRHASLFNFYFGLMRTETLRRTTGLGLYPMSDNVLFAELAMLGELREIREPLLRLRVHGGRSLRAHVTAQARRELFDPSLAGKRVLLSLQDRVQLELVKAALRTPQRAADKAACLAVAAALPPWSRLRNFVGLQKERLLRPGRRPSPAG